MSSSGKIFCVRSAAQSDFSQFVREHAADQRLVVQARMGFTSIDAMRDALTRVREANCTAVGTVTLDSFTRVGNYTAAERAVDLRQELNGFPIVAHGSHKTADMLRGLVEAEFPVQVRHGSPKPELIFRTMAGAGLTCSEGGPVSYTLPYGREPLASAVHHWTAGCIELASRPGVHIETFGGCMLGQLCPPSVLVAISLLEAMYFREQGIRSLSLSYAQQTNRQQDLEALQALVRLADHYLSDCDWHIVLYTFMGLFPRTTVGVQKITQSSVALALFGGAERLIVKTEAEAHRIPTVNENIEALEYAHAYANELRKEDLPDGSGYNRTLSEAGKIVGAVLKLDGEVGRALVEAFNRGLLDVPFCLHPDNHGAAKAWIDEFGRVDWLNVGRVPIRQPLKDRRSSPRITAEAFLEMLSFNIRMFDGE